MSWPAPKRRNKKRKTKVTMMSSTTRLSLHLTVSTKQSRQTATSSTSYSRTCQQERFREGWLSVFFLLLSFLKPSKTKRLVDSMRMFSIVGTTTARSLRRSSQLMINSSRLSNDIHNYCYFASKASKDTGSMYIGRAGIPMILFSLLGVWVVATGIEGKNKERDTFQGRMSV